MRSSKSLMSGCEIPMAGKILETSRPSVSVRDFSREEIIAYLRKALRKHANVLDAFLFDSLKKRKKWILEILS